MENKQQKQFVRSVEQQCLKSEATNKPRFNNVFKAFRRNYQLVPLEVFGKDPYKTLISTILSSRTKDEVTLVRSRELFKKAKSFKELQSLSEREIQEIIYPVGFYKTKAKHLKQLASLNLNEIPKTREELIKLPGVGRKTANLTLNRAFGIPAIAVDTHVHRICNTLGWVKTKLPEETERELIGILPKKYWSETNRLFVSIGRQYTTNKKLLEFLKKENLVDKF